jgi:receptor expression-enhancing protein 5/6
MTAIVATYQDKLQQLLNKPGKVSDTLKLLEDKTGVKRLYIAYGVISFTTLWLMFGYGAGLLCNMVGFVYPAYSSIKALESSVKKDDTQWLTYWVVFAFFSLLEFFSDILVGWVPFYWLSKCLFLVWCMAPFDSNGSSVIYNRIILPLFYKHQPLIDNMMNKAQDKAGEIFDQAVEKAKDVAAEQQLNKNKDE